MVRRDIIFGTFNQTVPAFEYSLDTSQNSPLDLFQSHLSDNGRLNEHLTDIGYDNLFYVDSLDLLMNHYRLRVLVLKPCREIILEADNSI